MTITGNGAVARQIVTDTSGHLADSAEVVAARGVGKTFRPRGAAPRQVLSGIDLTVRRGEIVSIVGPSGCGKTTLLRMIQGLEPTSEGQILIEGTHAGAGGVEAGFVFQQPSLFPWFTLRRNIAFGLALRTRADRMTKSEQSARVADLIGLVGLDGFADYRPHQLSGGMQQRANLARALAIDPAVLLLDEPFSAVDTLTRERLQRVLSGLLSRLEATAILVTHDIREAVFLGSRVVLMGGTPGGIVSEHQVDAPFPRTESFQHSTALAEIAQLVYAELRANANETVPAR